MLPVLRRTRSQTKQSSQKIQKPVNKRRNVKVSDDYSTKTRSVFVDITNATSRLAGLEKKVPPKSNTKNEGKIKCSSSCENMIIDDEEFFQSPTSGGSPSYATADESIESVSNESMVATLISEQGVKEETKSSEEKELKGGIWPGVVDFDAENRSDPFSVSEYAVDIFNYYREREKLFISDKYMHKQRQITKGMRKVLINWLVELQDGFELNHESLYLAVKLIDLYLSQKIVEKNQLQLVGATAVFIASKFDERSPPAIQDFLYVCDNAYSKQELIHMEIDILKTLDFDLGIPLSYTFLRRYARCDKLPMETLTLARYVLELSLTDYDLIDVKESLIAAAALLVALKMKHLEWTKTLHYYSGYDESELIEVARSLNRLIVCPKHAEIIIAKYSHKVFFEVAKTPTVVI